MNISRNSVAWTLAACLAAGTATAQIPRTDTAECALPGGHRIELASRYSWVPVNLHPRSNRSHFDQQDYRATLKPAKGRSLVLKAPLDGTPMDDGVATMYCGQFGAIGNLVFSEWDLVDTRTRTVFDLTGLEALAIALPDSLRSPRHQALLDERGLSFPSGWAFGRIGGRILAEQGLVREKENGEVRAVMRFEWREVDKAWKEFGIFDTSELFVIGQDWEAQPFIGKPFKVNGKRPR